MKVIAKYKEFTVVTIECEVTFIEANGRQIRVSTDQIGQLVITAPNDDLLIGRSNNGTIPAVIVKTRR